MPLVKVWTYFVGLGGVALNSEADDGQPPKTNSSDM